MCFESRSVSKKGLAEFVLATKRKKQLVVTGFTLENPILKDQLDLEMDRDSPQTRCLATWKKKQGVVMTKEFKMNDAPLKHSEAKKLTFSI